MPPRIEPWVERRALQAEPGPTLSGVIRGKGQRMTAHQAAGEDDENRHEGDPAKSNQDPVPGDEAPTRGWPVFVRVHTSWEAGCRFSSAPSSARGGTPVAVYPNTPASKHYAELGELHPLLD
jgi:hypothetical protein